MKHCHYKFETACALIHDMILLPLVLKCVFVLVIFTYAISHYRIIFACDIKEKWNS
jgi:hypothetical protein